MRKYGKYIILFVLIITLIVGLNWPGNEKYLHGLHKVEISIKDYGKMKLELDGDTAPITVTNFINLVNDKFYDGLTMHRIINGFMIQGGESKYKTVKSIKGEFLNNGVNNDIKHLRGVISMARTNDMNSASSQFFIVHKDSPHLDGNYAAFGKVVSGIDVIDKIVENTHEFGDSNGIIPDDKQPIIEYIKVIE